MSVVNLTEIKGGKTDADPAAELGEELATALNKYGPLLSIVTMVGLLEALKFDLLTEANDRDD